MGIAQGLWIVLPASRAFLRPVALAIAVVHNCYRCYSGKLAAIYSHALLLLRWCHGAYTDSYYQYYFRYCDCFRLLSSGFWRYFTSLTTSMLILSTRILFSIFRLLPHPAIRFSRYLTSFTTSMLMLWLLLLLLALRRLVSLSMLLRSRFELLQQPPLQLLRHFCYLHCDR